MTTTAVVWTLTGERDLLALPPSEAERLVDEVDAFALTGRGFVRRMLDGSDQERLYLSRRLLRRLRLRWRVRARLWSCPPVSLDAGCCSIRMLVGLLISARRHRAAALGALLLLMACEDAPKPAPLPAVSEAPPPAPPPREGCAKTGSLSSLESDPTCIARRVPEDAMRTALKHLSMNLGIEPNEVSAGGTALITVTVTNTSSSETTIFLEARPRAPGARTDWSRVVGIPEPKVATTAEIPRLFFPTTTLDSYDHDVDALPTVSGSAASPPPPVTTLAVHLRPGGKLTHSASWWALRIPAPAPIVQDDAGHRYIPKTSALPLMAGEYSIVVDLPLFALSREERKVVTRVRVVRATLPDGGLKKQSPF